jgi:serine/threonine-protein kinase HipA
LSISLPLQEDPFPDAPVRAFFDNLLQENQQLANVRDRFRLDRDDVAGLLFHLGSDLAGAISCVPSGEKATKRPGCLASDYDRLAREDLAAIMRALRDFGRLPPEARDPSPLAGVQPKLALVDFGDGSFGLPRPGTSAPTTHILKMPSAREPNLALQETTLLDTARTVVGHPVVEARVISLDGMEGLLVRRFDRVVESGMVTRLHQEDFAQALGLPAAMKYEHRGGFFHAGRVGELLAETDAPLVARLAFLRATVMNIVFGNTDNHAKNHALLHVPGRSRPVLAPLYDIVPVVLDRNVHHDFAFRIGKAARLEELTGEDFPLFLGALGLARAGLRQKQRISELLGAIVASLDRLNGPRLKLLGDMIASRVKHLAEAWGLDVMVPDRDAHIEESPAFRWP